MSMILGVGRFGIMMMSLPRVLSAYQFKHNQPILRNFWQK